MTSPARSPSSQRAVAFGPFLLDRPAGRLWRDRAPVALRPKAWEVLGYLVDRPGVLVSAGELFDEIWKGVAVTPQTLMNVVAQLRVALGDDAREPRWLETVRGRGYRFIGALQAPLEQESDATVAEPGADSGPRMQSGSAEEEWARPLAPLVGRGREIGALTAAWRRTLASGRQVIVLTGEAGIGKTTLVEAFARSLDGDRALGRVLVTRGYCVEHHGAHEPYMPVLSAIEGLADESHRALVGSLLRRHAPTWLLQIPFLVEPGERAQLERAVLGTTAARMLREGSSFFEAIAREVPTVLVLEDLHWSDASTLDFVTLLGQRTASAKLLLLFTCRPAPLVDEPSTDELVERLRGTADAEVIALPPLDSDSIASYLAIRLADRRRAAALAPEVEVRSAGNPLFLRSLVDEIVEQDRVPRAVSDPSSFDRDDASALSIGGASEAPPWVIDSGDLPTPRALRALVERHLHSLTPALRALVETASVAGVDFAAVELADAVECSPEDV